MIRRIIRALLAGQSRIASSLTMSRPCSAPYIDRVIHGTELSTRGISCSREPSHGGGHGRHGLARKYVQDGDRRPVDPICVDCRLEYVLADGVDGDRITELCPASGS